jgi:hypothetical protein
MTAWLANPLIWTLIILFVLTAVIVITVATTMR